MMKDLNWKAIGTGLLISLTVSQIIAGVWKLCWPAMYMLRGLNYQMAIAQIEPTAGLHIRLIISDLLTRIIAGYVAAGKKSEQAIGNAAIVGGLDFLLYELFVWNDRYRIPLWYQIISPLVVFLFTLLGGYIRLRRNLDNRVLDSLQPPIPLP